VRRAARVLVPAGIVMVVLFVGDYHVKHRGDYEVSLWTWAYIGLLVVTAYGAGLPDLTRTGRSAVGAATGAAAAAALGISAVQLAAGSLLLPRFVVFASALFLIPWLVACTVVASGGRKQERYHDRVVLVAGEDESAALREELGRQPEHFAHLAEVLTPSEAKPASRGAEPLVDRAITADATVIVLDRVASADPAIVSQAAVLHEAGLRVRTMALFYEEWLGKLPVSELERLSLMFDIGELHRARYGRSKRIADVIVGLLGCAVLVVVLPVVWILNVVGNRGPLLYRQPRVGRDRQLFTILKLRSMRPGDGPTEWTGERDPRITPVGRWLRRLHLDELPQAVNMVAGDLSLIGPRPEQPHYVDELAAKLPWYHVRHLVRPGLTGWAQVKYAYGATEEDALEKLQYELYYLRHQGLALDLRIVGRTLRHVVGLGGR
jgi:lipopolysaccharide/colanic/teichoic acid biosynthesis glycosyltransferase